MRSLKSEYSDTLHVVGFVLRIVGFGYLFPLLAVVFFNEAWTHALAFIGAFIGTELLALLFLKKLKADEDRTSFTFQQGALGIVGAWLLTMLISAGPFMAILGYDFTRAVFESVSGWTTSGLTTVAVEAAPGSILLFRSLLQFFGGFGLVALAASSIIGVGSLNALYDSEGHDRLLPNIKKTARSMFQIYIGLMVLGVLLYILAGMPAFDALNHSLSGISTGGFSVKEASIGHYDSVAIEGVTFALMLFGSTNFAAHILLFRRDFKSFFRITENRFFYFMLISMSIIAVLILWNLGFAFVGESLRHGAFETVSAITGTGYTISDYSAFPGAVVFFILIMMILGGQSGSTSGGLKMTRINLIRKNLSFAVRRIFQPEHQVTENVVQTPAGQKLIHKQDVIEIFNFVSIYMLALIIGTLVLTTQGAALKDGLFEFASTIGTVGLTIGVTAPEMPLLSQWTMIAGMFFGRLEFLIVLIVLVKLFRDAKIGITRARRTD